MSATVESRPIPVDDRGRDFALDLLRGLCLAKMIIAHGPATPGHPYLGALTFVSAAEGFFFISGIVVGMIWRRRLATRPLGDATRGLWRRAVQLYVVNLILIVLAHAWDYVGRQYGLPHLGYTYSWIFYGNWQWYSVFSIDQPYFLQVLPRYTVFLLVTPAALWLLLRDARRGGWTGTATVIGVTFGLWFLRHLPADARPDLRLPWIEHGRYAGFTVVSWQVVFFSGLLVGWWKDRLAFIWRWIDGRRAFALLVLVNVCLLVASLLLAMQVISLPHALATRSVDRDYMGGLRLVNLALLAPLLYAWTWHRWPTVRRSVGWLLLPIGTWSLLTFVVHIPLTQVAILSTRKWSGQWVAGLVDLLLLALVYGVVVVWARRARKKRPSQ